MRSGEYRTERNVVKGRAFLCLGRLGVRTGKNSFPVKRIIKISYGKRYVLEEKGFGNSTEPLVKPLEGHL